MKDILKKMWEEIRPHWLNSALMASFFVMGTLYGQVKWQGDLIKAQEVCQQVAEDVKRLEKQHDEVIALCIIEGPIEEALLENKETEQ